MKESMNLALAEIQNYLKETTDPRIKPEVLIEETETFDFGYVFFYQSAKYIQTGDRRYLLGGNAPLIYDIDKKEIHITGTRLPLKYYIQLYRKHRYEIEVFNKTILSYVPDEWK